MAVTSLSEPWVQKKALLIAVQHVEAHDGSDLEGLSDLAFAHRDTETLRSFLIDSHEYQPDDIIVMKDDPDHPRCLWPTYRKILHQIDKFTSNVTEGCHLVFYFSGHGLEEECHGPPSTRADRQDADIVSADGKRISDHDLHKHLLEPLEKVKGAKLFALFDCCHSESILDLQMGSEPNQYERVWDFGRDELFKVIAISIVTFLWLRNRHLKEGRLVARRQASIKLAGSPHTVAPHEVGRLSVICLSACRDKQFAHDIGGDTFTKCFIEAASENPCISWAELRDTLKKSVSKIQKRWEEKLHKPCRQDPRYCTQFHTDLTESISHWL